MFCFWIFDVLIFFKGVEKNSHGATFIESSNPFHIFYFVATASVLCWIVDWCKLVAAP